MQLQVFLAIGLVVLLGLIAPVSGKEAGKLRRTMLVR